MIELTKFTSPKEILPEKLLQIIGSNMEKEVQMRFRKEVDPQGNKWKPLSKKTIELRRKNSGKILNDTGVLKNSFVKKVGKDYAIVGTNKEYALQHQFGNRSKRIPARPFIGFSKTEIELYGKLVKRYIKNNS